MGCSAGVVTQYGHSVQLLWRCQITVEDAIQNERGSCGRIGSVEVITTANKSDRSLHVQAHPCELIGYRDELLIRKRIREIAKIEALICSTLLTERGKPQCKNSKYATHPRSW